MTTKSMERQVEEPRWRNYIDNVAEEIGEKIAIAEVANERRIGLAKRVYSNVNCLMLESDNQSRIRNFGNFEDNFPDPVYQKLLEVDRKFNPSHELGLGIHIKITRLRWRIMTEKEYNHILNSPVDKLSYELFQIGREEFSN